MSPNIYEVVYSYKLQPFVVLLWIGEASDTGSLSIPCLQCVLKRGGRWL